MNSKDGSSPRSLLLSLPQEIRNEIYSHVFSTCDLGFLPLLRTCRQIYDEAHVLATRTATLTCHIGSVAGLRVSTCSGLRELKEICAMLGPRTKDVKSVEICTCHWSICLSICSELVKSSLQKLFDCEIEPENLVLSLDDDWCIRAAPDSTWQRNIAGPEGRDEGILGGVHMMRRLIFERETTYRHVESAHLICRSRRHGMFKEDWDEIRESSRRLNGGQPRNPRPKKSRPNQGRTVVVEPRKPDMVAMEKLVQEACQYHREKGLDEKIKLDHTSYHVKESIILDLEMRRI